MSEVKAKPYSPAYELARELIAGEFANSFRDEPDKAFTRTDISKLANIIDEQRGKHADLISLVESNQVQDYLTNLAASYGAKFSNGGAIITHKSVVCAGAIEQDGILYKLVSEYFDDEKDKAEQGKAAYESAGYKSLIVPCEGGFGLYAEWKTMNPQMAKGGKVDLGSGHLGNGITVWDRTRKENRDYKTVAHISEEGVIDYYDKELPATAIAEIERMAERQKAIKEIWGGSSGYINYGQHYIDNAKRITDQFNEILAKEKDNKGFTPITPQNIRSIKYVQPTHGAYDIEYGNGDFALIQDTHKLNKVDVNTFITHLPHIQKSLENGIGGYNYYAKGGSIRNISRDRKFISQEYWEQAYKKHRVTKGKRYHRYGEGGIVSASELVGQTFFVGDTTGFGNFVFAHGFSAYDTDRLANKLTILNQNSIPFVAEYQHGTNSSNGHWDILVLEKDYPEVITLFSADIDEDEFEAAQEHAGQYGKGGGLPFSDRYSATVGEEEEGKGFPVFAQITGYAPTTVGYYKTKELAQNKANKLLADNKSKTVVIESYKDTGEFEGSVFWRIKADDGKIIESGFDSTADAEDWVNDNGYKLSITKKETGGNLGKEIKFRQYDYDVWGNDEDGYTVNNRFKTPTVVTLYENQTDEQIIKALQEQGVLSAKANKDNVEIDGEMGYTLFLNDLSGISPKPLLELVNEAPEMASGGAVSEDSFEVEGILHTRSMAAHLHHNKEYKRIEGSGHPLGDVYVKKHNPKYGYVPSGYSWYKFDLKQWNEKNPTMEIVSELLAKGGHVRNLHRDRMFISQQDWEQIYKPNRVKRGKYYHHHYADGGEVGSALAWLKSLDLTKLPKVVSKHLAAIIENPESENIELGDNDFVELKTLIETKFASAIPTQEVKEEVKEVKQEVKEVSVAVLKTRIKIIKAKIKAEPKNKLWKTRLKVVSAMIDAKEGK